MLYRIIPLVVALAGCNLTGNSSDLGSSRFVLHHQDLPDPIERAEAEWQLRKQWNLSTTLGPQDNRRSLPTTLIPRPITPSASRSKSLSGKRVGSNSRLRRLASGRYHRRYSPRFRALAATITPQGEANTAEAGLVGNGSEYPSASSKGAELPMEFVAIPAERDSLSSDTGKRKQKQKQKGKERFAASPPHAETDQFIPSGLATNSLAED